MRQPPAPPREIAARLASPRPKPQNAGERRSDPSPRREGERAPRLERAVAAPPERAGETPR